MIKTIVFIIVLLLKDYEKNNFEYSQIRIINCVIIV